MSSVFEEMFHERMTGPMVERHDPMSGEDEEPRTQRERRLALAREKQMVRAALQSAALHGYYVFDELITEEAGIIDFLVVGPLDVISVVVRPDRGYVSLDKQSNTLLLDGRPFEDNPYEQGLQIAADVDKRIFEGNHDSGYIVCFIYAPLEVDEDNQIPHATTPIWELPWALDPEGVENLDTAQIEEIAEKVQQVYDRPPIIRPRISEGEV